VAGILGWLVLKENVLLIVGDLKVVVDDGDVATVVLDEDILADEDTEDMELDRLTRVLTTGFETSLGEAFGVDFSN
jgi:hypothetical protein